MFSNSGCCSLLELLEGDILVDKEEDNNVAKNERALTKTEFGWLRCSVRPAEWERRVVPKANFPQNPPHRVLLHPE